MCNICGEVLSGGFAWLENILKLRICRVYKDECMFSYDSPLSPEGLYISLSSWQAFGKNFVKLDNQRTGNLLYLHIKSFKVGMKLPTYLNKILCDKKKSALIPTKNSISFFLLHYKLVRFSGVKLWLEMLANSGLCLSMHPIFSIIFFSVNSLYIWFIWLASVFKKVQ